MKVQFIIKGSDYSKNKDALKKILKKYGLQWKGTMTNAFWRSEKEILRASFERNEEKDITIMATLIWEGEKKTPFLKELKAWTSKLECKIASVKKAKTTAEEDFVQKELEFWDKINRPDVEYLRATGRPEAWIKKDLKEWKVAREKKRKELLAKFSL